MRSRGISAYSDTSSALQKPSNPINSEINSKKSPLNLSLSINAKESPISHRSHHSPAYMASNNSKLDS